MVSAYSLIPGVQTGLKKHSRVKLHKDIHHRVRGLNGRRSTLDVDINGRLLRLVVSENSELFHRDAQFPHAYGSKAVFLSGKVEGDEDSSVRISVFENGQIEGRIKLGHGEILHLETMKSQRGTSGLPGNAIAADEWQTVAYTSDDVEKVNEGKCKIFDGELFHDDHEVSHIDSPTLRTIFMNGTVKSESAFQQLSKRGDVTLNNRTECAMAVIGDIKFYQKYGDHSMDLMLSLMNEVQENYLEQLNVGLPIIYATIITSATDRSGFGNPATNAEDFVLNAAFTTFQRRWPGWTSNLASNICLVHVMTYQDFSGTLGIAVLGDSENRGACATNGGNVGISTMMTFGRDLVRSSIVSTITHEIGHNFGSMHDQDYANSTIIQNWRSCLPNTNVFNMYANILPSKNGQTFSECSLYAFRQKMPLATCLKVRGSLSFPTISTPKRPDFDQCQNPPSPLPNTPPDGYFECPFIFAGYECSIVCAPPGLTAQCTAFQNGGSPLQKRDYTACGVNYPKPDVCVSGSCVPDTRSYVCDRSKPCCNAFGTLQPAGYVCGEKNGVPNVCRPQANVCDPTAPSFQDECPFTILKPGTLCDCTDPSNSATCKSDIVCGTGRSLGLCVNSSAPATNRMELCNGFTCSSGQTCVVLGNTPTCIQTVQPSCRYLCHNDEFGYNSTMGGVTTRWFCDCRSDCAQRRTCCADFVDFCGWVPANATVSSPATLTAENSAGAATTTSSRRSQETTTTGNNVRDIRSRVQNFASGISSEVILIAVIIATVVLIAVIAYVVIINKRRGSSEGGKETTRTVVL